ncbi:hypothetical protein [Methanobrevibacter thaueri]|uniref:hypothetical protein n=1 Tax=Methanobrevibacter thaueri TaxID=190975 RepID=UPI00386499C8
MKIKRYIILILILLIFVNLSSIYATDNATDELQINNGDPIDIDETICTYVNDEDEVFQSDEINQTNQEILTQNQQEDILSDFEPYNTEITLTVNDTSDFETTGNITMNMAFSFTASEHNGEFTAQNISIYENNTLIKTLNIGEQNLPELGIITGTGASFNIYYEANILFDYTVHDNSYLTTSLFGVYSNTLHFKKLKNTLPVNLNTTQINIDDIYCSNKTWTNSIKSLKKALELAKNDGIIYLNNIDFIQDTSETIEIIKNITITGHDASFILQKTQTLLEINPNTEATLINLTFSGNNNYVISNKGKLQLINCTFKDNSLGLIDNYGELEITNCNFQDLNQFYQTKTTNTNGLVTNSGILKITKTTFNNNNPLPYNFPIESNILKGIIYNNGTLTINEVNFTNINYRIIYNDGELSLKNTLFENILSTSPHSFYKNQLSIYTISTDQYLNQNHIYNNYQLQINAKTTNGGVIYNTNQINIFNSSFKSIIGSNGGVIYNTNQINIFNSSFKSISGNDGGVIYNAGKLIIENTILNQSISNSIGGSIYNNGETVINNSKILESKLQKLQNSLLANNIDGGGIYNDGILNISNSEIKKCWGAGAAIFNNNILNIENSQLFDNTAFADIKWRVINDIGWTVVDKVYSGVIYNGENANANIIKSVIKNNILYANNNDGGWRTYYGNIKNDGNLLISGCIFDNNTPYWDGLLNQGDGSFNIFNRGKITVMYCYLLNTKNYIATAIGTGTHSPYSFLYNTGKGTCNINYNFYCLNPSSIIANAKPNYYFIPSFNDYIPIKLNENANITLTLGLSNGIDKIDFNDWDKLLTPGLNATITTLNENGEYINITTFLKDKYSFNFNYTNTKGEYLIYCNIMNYTNTGIVDVGKEFSEMTVTYNNITYNDGNKITFHVKVTGNLTVQPTGNVTFTYNNQKITLNLTNGECNYTIDETLKPANYTMRIDYNGDEEYFKIIKQFYPFTVNKIRTNVTLSAPEIKIGETGKLTITITPRDAKLYGYLYYTTDRLYKTNADTRGTRTLTLKNFPVGIHNLTVIFEEDEYYTGGTFTTFFTVSKYETQLNVTAADVPPGQDNTTVNITINPGDVRGEAIVEINGKNETVYLNDTTTRIPVTDLEEGTYTVNIYYPGDAKYAPSNGTTTFSVARITSRITCEISYDEHMNGHVTVNANHNNCTGEVRLYINNDDPLKLNLTDGKANFTAKFKRGTNYIYLYYYGDEYYSFSTWNRTFTIDATPVLTLETQDLRSDSTGYVRINLTDTNAIPYEYTDITIEFNNQTITLKTDENGTVYYPVQLPAGKYSIKATYGNATIIKNITVKTTTRITVEIPSINQDEDLMAYVTLTDYNNQKITGDVILEINGQYYKIIATNGAGSRNLGEMKAGNYNYNATYIGEGLLASSQTTGTFNVAANNYRITGNKNINAYYGANKNYKIQLLNNNKPIKDAIITIKINKNTVQVKTDTQGYATLKLTLKPGKYTITSTYKNVKVTNKITVKPTLITKNKKIKKGKTLTYTAKLLNKNGKKLKNKKITFKINGKKYKAKTNKKGIAKIKVKNLKKGKYKIKTTYGKQKNTNTITVK